jgi:hypothetical protein
MAVQGLSAEQINALMAGSRTKGQYSEALGTFLESGEAGVSVDEAFPHLAGKNAGSVKQGFDGARTKKDAPEGADQVRVIKQGDTVYLLNQALIAGAEAA